MNNLLHETEKLQIQKLTQKKSIPAFRAGDTLRVTLKIVEGERSRLQSFEGVCVARKNNSINSKFTVRKLSHGEGVERIFPLFSPLIDKIEVIRKGDVKRAKLYYLRKRTGKSARIADSDRGEEADEYSLSEETISENDNKQPSSSEDVNTSKIDDNQDKQDNITNKESSSDKDNKTVEEEKKLVEKVSESTASEAGKTKDESKS